MKSDWSLVIILWSLLIGTVGVLLYREANKTPEQKKAEEQKRRELREKEERRLQEVKRDTPEKGCLQSTLEFCIVSVFTIVVLFFCIILLIATGD